MLKNRSRKATDTITSKNFRFLNVPKQYNNAIYIYWTDIAFSVLDHNSVQSVVIQKLAVTELFCTA